MSLGDKPLKITWMFNDLRIDNRIRIKTRKISEKSSLLMIPQTTSHHSGRYTCIAENAAGIVSYSTNLTINGSF